MNPQLLTQRIDAILKFLRVFFPIPKNTSVADVGAMVLTTASATTWAVEHVLPIIPGRQRALGFLAMVVRLLKLVGLTLTLASLTYRYWRYRVRISYQLDARRRNGGALGFLALDGPTHAVADRLVRNDDEMELEGEVDGALPHQALPFRSYTLFQHHWMCWCKANFDCRPEARSRAQFSVVRAALQKELLREARVRPTHVQLAVDRIVHLAFTPTHNDVQTRALLNCDVVRAAREAYAEAGKPAHPFQRGVLAEEEA